MFAVTNVTILTWYANERGHGISDKIACMSNEVSDQALCELPRMQSRVFPQGLKMRVPGTPICGVKGSFNKI